MGSASKGKRVASGPIGGKAKHARIGMSLLFLYSNPVGQRMRRASASQKMEGARAGHGISAAITGQRMEGTMLNRG